MVGSHIVVTFLCEYSLFFSLAATRIICTGNREESAWTKFGINYDNIANNISIGLPVTNRLRIIDRNFIEKAFTYTAYDRRIAR